MHASTTGPRCDRCGVTAKIGYIRGVDLWEFCAHHGREHDKALTDRGYERVTLALPDVPNVGSRAITGS
jgi:hypothetical protein